MKRMIAVCALLCLLLGLAPTAFADNPPPGPAAASVEDNAALGLSNAQGLAQTRSGNTPQDGPGGTSRRRFEKKDIPRALEYSARENRNLAPVLPQNRPAPPANPYFVQPVLFVASDLAPDPENAPAIAATFELLRRWYSGALELKKSGYVFRLSAPVIYHAPQPFSYYKCPNHEPVCDNYDGIWGNVQVELMNAGYPLWSAGTSYVVFVKGAGGWAGGNCVPDCGSNAPAPGPAAQAGFAILGDWALDAITGVLNEECYANMGSACYQDPQRGAVGHELGHTFGLAHAQEQYGSIMYSWWEFPYESLMGDPGNDEKSVLRDDSPFFSPYGCNPDAYAGDVTMPSTVAAATQFAASLTFVNYGYCHWAAGATGVRIVEDNVWGVRTVPLGQDIYPAQPYTFSLLLTAPTLPASKTSQSYASLWRMHASTGYFGQQAGTTITFTR